MNFTRNISQRKTLNQLSIDISKAESYKKLFDQLENLASLTSDSKMIRDIVHHVLTTPCSYVLAIETYYEPENLASQFSTKRIDEKWSVWDRSSVL